MCTTFLFESELMFNSRHIMPEEIASNTISFPEKGRQEDTNLSAKTTMIMELSHFLCP